MVFGFDTEIKRQTGTDGKEYKVHKGGQIMEGENFLVTRKDGFLSVVQNRSYRTKDGKEHIERRVFNVAGNTEGLEEGDILRSDNLDFTLKRVKYTEDGKQCSKTVMLLYGWEKAEEA